jgi:hypothetical protein
VSNWATRCGESQSESHWARKEACWTGRRGVNQTGRGKRRGRLDREAWSESNWVESED